MSEFEPGEQVSKIRPIEARRLFQDVQQQYNLDIAALPLYDLILQGKGYATPHLIASYDIGDFAYNLGIYATLKTIETGFDEKDLALIDSLLPSLPHQTILERTTRFALREFHNNDLVKRFINPETYKYTQKMVVTPLPHRGIMFFFHHETINEYEDPTKVIDGLILNSGISKCGVSVGWHGAGVPEQLLEKMISCASAQNEQ